MKHLRPLLVPLSFVAALCAATLWLISADERFVVVDSELLSNLDFRNGLQHWAQFGPGIGVTSDEPPALVIAANSSRRPPYVARQIANPSRFSAIQISAELSAKSLVVGDERWHGAKLLMITYDRGGRQLYYWPTVVESLTGTQHWQPVKTTFPVHKNAGVLLLAAYAAGTQGNFYVRNLSAVAVQERPSFRMARYATIGAWLLLGLWLNWLLLRQDWRRPTRLLAVLAVNGALIAGLVPQPHLNQALKKALTTSQDVLYELRANLSGSELTSTAPPASTPGAKPPSDSQPTTRTTQQPSAAASQTKASGGTASPSSKAAIDDGGAARFATTSRKPRHYWVPNWKHLDKTEHLIGFAVVTILVCLGYRRYSLAARVAPLVGLAAAIQTLQSFSITRDADIEDLFADLIGLTVGLIVVTIAAKLIRASKPTQPGAGERRGL